MTSLCLLFIYSVNNISVSFWPSKLYGRSYTENVLTARLVNKLPGILRELANIFDSSTTCTLAFRICNINEWFIWLEPRLSLLRSSFSFLNPCTYYSFLRSIASKYLYFLGMLYIILMNWATGMTTIRSVDIIIALEIGLCTGILIIHPSWVQSTTLLISLLSTWI